MTIETMLERQIAVNAVILGESLKSVPTQVYYVVDPATAAWELLGLEEQEFEDFLAGVVCRNWDWEQMEVDGE